MLLAYHRPEAGWWTNETEEMSAQEKYYLLNDFPILATELFHVLTPQQKKTLTSFLENTNFINRPNKYLLRTCYAQGIMIEAGDTI